MEITLQTLLGAAFIFALRVCDMSLDTLRVMFVMRGRKPIAWILGFFQATIFVVAFTYVLNDVQNPINVIGYAAGFATGNVIGMSIEERLAVGHIHLRIISPHRGAEIAERLREDGYAVTEVSARGKDGMVTVLNCNVKRKRMDQVDRVVTQIDDEAFLTAEDVSPIWRGFWRA
jgi:uncharacterized protein YebE (UPF0316 family)